jgi:PKD repeat protein
VANEVVNWSLTNRSGGVVPGDLVPSGSNRSAAFTGHHAGAARIRASHATLGNDTTGLITVTNRPPVAIAGPDQSVNVGDSVQLDGSSSYDFENDPLTYSWVFVKKPSQSQAPLNNPDSVRPSFTPDQGGEYVIQLVVNDGIDDSAPDDVSVFSKSPPVALFEYQPKTGFVPCKFLFDASDSYDSDGHIVSYEWDFGDFSKGIGVNPSHIYASRGEFLISLKVTDNDGLTDKATAKIKVQTCHPPTNVSLKREINRSLFRKEAFHTLSWSSNPENFGLTIINYRIYRKKAGEGDGSYHMIGNVSGNTFIYVDGYLDMSEKFVYVITSVESSGHESKKSSSARN